MPLPQVNGKLAVMIKIPPPATEAELWHRACDIAHQPLGTLAAQMAMPLPPDLKRDKGWIGQMLEQVLGATAGSLAKPDFPHLSIELKTIPLKADGKPKESTYISIVPLLSSQLLTWRDSDVYHKLQRILWIPYFFDDALSPREWHLSQPVLWSPSVEEEAILKEDWEELMSLVQLGNLDQINARIGQYLQIRPKAMNAAVRTQGIGQEGVSVRTSPLGFYLRTVFTEKIIDSTS